MISLGVLFDGRGAGPFCYARLGQGQQESGGQALQRDENQADPGDGESPLPFLPRSLEGGQKDGQNGQARQEHARAADGASGSWNVLQPSA
jgi:hypothetical protein